MKKKIAVMVVLILMVGSLCGAVVFGADLPNSVKELRKVVEAGTALVYGDVTPDDGVPGGPPGIPG